MQQRHAGETLKSSYNDIGKDDESTPSAGGLETPSGGELRDDTFLFINKESFRYTPSAFLFTMTFFLTKYTQSLAKEVCLSRIEFLQMIFPEHACFVFVSVYMLCW